MTLTPARPAQGWVGPSPLGQLLSRVLLGSSTDCSSLGSSVHAISRQEYWAELPLLTQGIFPTQGLNHSLLRLLHGQADSLPPCHLLGRVLFHLTLPLALHTVFPGFSESMCCT